ncbi:MAG: type II toxin-antitoxin system HicB family antitoxin [Rhodospirillales bacterium]|nr:type II toxin-antitoxin system HicB family antitoxin [Rhodospirillales bacterium]
MQGYIAIVERRSADHFEVVFPDLDGCRCRGRSVNDALYRGQRAVRRHLRQMRHRGMRPPPPRPSCEMFDEAQRRRAVAAMCVNAQP